MMQQFFVLIRRAALISNKSAISKEILDTNISTCMMYIYFNDNADMNYTPSPDHLIAQIPCRSIPTGDSLRIHGCSLPSYIIERGLYRNAYRVPIGGRGSDLLFAIQEDEVLARCLDTQCCSDLDPIRIRAYMDIHTNKDFRHNDVTSQGCIVYGYEYQDQIDKIKMSFGSQERVIPLTIKVV